MHTLYRKVELLSNLAIIIAALALTILLAQRYLIAPAPADSRAASPEIAVGSKVALPGVDWAKNGQTLLLVLQAGCHYCTESAAFYQRLVQEAAGREDLQLLAAFPHTAEDGRKYLDGLNLNIREVRQISFDALGVAGTPTLLLVDRSGIVSTVWVGQLPPEQEQEVLRRLQAARASSLP